MPHISIAAEKIGSVFGLPITNSLLATWIVMAMLIVFSIAATRKMTLVPTGIQSIAELVVGGLYDFFTSVVGKHIKQFFPLIASFFIFIITANWFGLLPGVGTVGFFEHGKFVPLLRGATADLNTTLALAVISIVAIQYFGFKTVGFHYSRRFFNFKDPIYFFLGILEIISELSKVISFAFRLFGNIFAGEVLLTVMAFLMPFIAPLPFMALELFVGFIQALVFSMLTAAFLNVAVSHGEGGEV
jgi:F-type H+-transporting ATPase subunit a